MLKPSTSEDIARGTDHCSKTPLYADTTLAVLMIGEMDVQPEQRKQNLNIHTYAHCVILVLYTYALAANKTHHIYTQKVYLLSDHQHIICM